MEASEVVESAQFFEDGSETPKAPERSKIVSITISESSVKTVSRKNSFVVYKLDIGMRMDKDGDLRWQIYRRYSDFLEMHNQLPQDSLPKLPAKAIVGNFTATFLEGRRNSLENYLNELLKRRPVTQSEAFRGFIGQPNYAEDPLTSFPYSYRSGRPQGRTTAAKSHKPCLHCLIC